MKSIYVYDFLLMIDGNYVPNLHSFLIICIRKMALSKMTLKIKFKVKCKVTKIKAIYDFLFKINSNYAPNLHSFQVFYI